VANTIASLNDSQLEELLFVSNAGMLEPIGPTADKPDTDLLASMNTNFVSAILVMTEIVRRFQANACRKIIVNISSGAALNARAGWSLYGAAKAGMEHFLRALALEQETEAQPFLPINIDPGVMDTEMQALIRASSSEDFPDVEYFVGRKSQGLLATPKAVAASIARILEQPSLSPGGRYKASEYRG
jgi:NAD(P)-dependent dehydrogenase (short-subunit alcohol dehydrogenase family)